MVVEDVFAEIVYTERLFIDGQEIFKDEYSNNSRISIILSTPFINNGGFINFNTMYNGNDKISLIGNKIEIMDLRSLLEIEIDSVEFEKHSGSFLLNLYVNNNIVSTKIYKGPGTLMPIYGFQKIFHSLPKEPLTTIKCEITGLVNVNKIYMTLKLTY